MEKEFGKSVLIIIILIVYSCQMLAQVKTDTVVVGRDRVVFSYPEKSKVCVTNYEEGFFKDISCIEDTAIIGLHYGAMVNIPFIDRQGKNIISEYILANDLRQTRGFYYSNGERKYFREDNVLKYGINTYYTNVPEEKVLFYEALLDSLKYIVNPSELVK